MVLGLSASLDTSGGLLLGGNLHELGLIPCSEITLLNCQLGVLEDSYRKNHLISEPDVAAFIDQLRIVGDIVASGYLAAGPEVLQIKQLRVHVAAVNY